MSSQPAMFESRAQKLGLIGGRSPKSMAARTKKQLNNIRGKLTTLAAPYADIDNNIDLELNALLGEFDEFAAAIDDTVEWLLEEAPY
ncbi:MAG: hypothetical protein NXH95_13505 [Pseudomonadaceae bacterium]|nr:hypothetical protein [Pseudomonadaceae bacterium]